MVAGGFSHFVRFFFIYMGRSGRAPPFVAFALGGRFAILPCRWGCPPPAAGAVPAAWSPPPFWLVGVPGLPCGDVVVFPSYFVPLIHNILGARASIRHVVCIAYVLDVVRVECPIFPYLARSHVYGSYYVCAVY